MKRRIDLSVLLGITLSKQTDEIVIHAEGGSEAEYDYYYVYAAKRKIIENIARPYKALTGRNIVIVEYDSKSLKNVVTTKKEKKKDPKFSRIPLTGIVDVNAYLYPPQINQSNITTSSTSSSQINISSDSDKNQNSNDQPLKKGRSQTIFSRKKEVKEVHYEDFNILKVLGRGSFGKVCLVEYAKTKEIYAMKSLKKDVLIDQDQIENTLLEKKILMSLEHPFLVGMIFCFQTEDRIYFVMPFLRGGELFQHLKKMKFFTEEK
jgi:serum/glucocorticoid-regulated kinase 2